MTETGLALVTGAAGGIGSAVVRRLAESGWAVAALDLPSTDVEAMPARTGGRIRAYPVDVTDGPAVDAAVGRVEVEMGAITCVVSVAGLLRWGAVADFTSQAWEEVFGVNALGVFHVARAAARAMVPRAAGSIVTVGSDAASVPRAAMAAYAASKAAATQFTLCLGLELAPHGIRCNVVSPGSTDTAMRRSLWGDPAAAGGGSPAGTDPSAFRVDIPLGRVAAPEDVADAVEFLVSPRARHITLHDLRVDGGACLGA
ncbi:SDR family NAD(P)-dependent oxidoreductase [Nocardiopsis sp. LOL_012]|uniref:SDR family NAD(P)-dependent oxidoreductase n=1 Tax=Nocardiopsis sp. LOL_012 TaxID=3345409 RepID=UPI003A878131